MTQHRLAVAIVADDLTGALDTAAPFAAQGLDTWLALRAELAGMHAASRAEVLALTTESRHLSPEIAAQRVDAAMRAVAPQRSGIVFKKIDSVLRGNVRAEIVAAMLATGRRHAIICPAIPGQNRTMRGGTIYVNGLPLPAGGEDAEMPASAHLPDLLQPADGLQIHMIPAGQSAALSGKPELHAYVADAATETDLDALAHFVLRHSPEVMPVGASGLARALARLFATNGPPPLPEIGSGMLLFVIGSRREASAAQMLALRAAGADEIAVPVGRELNIENLPVRLPRSGGPSILLVRPESSIRTGATATEVAKRLARVAAVVVRCLRPAGLIMAGGDTAAACLDALDVERLHVNGELHDGIAFGTVAFGGGAMPFFTKSGSFGSRDTWIRLVALLRDGMP